MLSSKKLLAWYDKNARQLPWRVSPEDGQSGAQPNPYNVWLSEIMLQQTTVATVKDYYVRFLKKWPNVHVLAAAPLDDVLKMWAGLGYYARARNLHACAQNVAFDCNGHFPKTAKQLLQMPGIGAYTSAAIAAICYDEPVAVVDGNVDRLSARLLMIETPVRQAKKQIYQFVQNAVPTRAGDFAQGLMDLGATICTPKNPDCSNCPLKVNCRAFQTGTVEKFPVKPAKKPRPVRHGHCFVIQRKNGDVFLQKRGETGVLAKMAQVPNSDWADELPKLAFPVEGNWNSIGNITHIFTHFRLELKVWAMLNSEGVEHLDGYWVASSELSNEPLPTLFKKVLAAARISQKKAVGMHPDGS